jgi:hypothetical protein
MAARFIVFRSKEQQSAQQRGWGENHESADAYPSIHIIETECYYF